MSETRTANRHSKRELLPYRPELEEPKEEPGIVAVEEGAAVIEALTSETARALLEELYRDHGPASELAERVGTSLQNASYHLDRLQRAGIIAVIGTWYSSRGAEMDVYAPTKQPLVLVAGERSTKRAVTQRLSHLAGPDRESDG